MAVLSSLLYSDGSNASSDGTSAKQAGRQFASLSDTLKCYICEHYFNRPKILPCGHTFCSECLLNMRNSAQQEFEKSRDRNAHRRGECGFFTCPWPNCHYSMKLMNVSRWSLRNRAMSHAVTMAKKIEKEKQDVATQTKISLASVILSIPTRVLKNARSDPYLAPLPVTPPPSPSEMVLQQTLQKVLSTDSIDSSLFQRTDNSSKAWKSYAFAFGLCVFDQMLKLT